MELSVSSEEINEEMEKQAELERWCAKKAVAEREIENSKNIINTAKINYAKLQENIKVDYILMFVVVGFILYLIINGFGIALNLLSFSGYSCVLVGFMVAVSSYIVRRLYADLPIYFRCKSEEKGKSTNGYNYVKEINDEMVKIQQFKKDLKCCEDNISKISAEKN